MAGSSRAGPCACSGDSSGTGRSGDVPSVTRAPGPCQRGCRCPPAAGGSEGLSPCCPQAGQGVAAGMSPRPCASSAAPPWRRDRAGDAAGGPGGPCRALPVCTQPAHPDSVCSEPLRAPRRGWQDGGHLRVPLQGLGRAPLTEPEFRWGSGGRSPSPEVLGALLGWDRPCGAGAELLWGSPRPHPTHTQHRERVLTHV